LDTPIQSYTGQAMARCPDDVPWWRVVQADGAMKTAPGGDEQRARLRDEGVALTLDGRVDWSLTAPWSPAQRGATLRAPGSSFT